MSKYVLDENWVVWNGIKYARCRAITSQGVQCKRMSLKGLSVCRVHNKTPIGKPVIFGQGRADLVPFTQKVEELKADKDLRRFDEWIATTKALADDLRTRIDALGMTEDDRIKLANFCELATRILEREAKVLFSTRNVLSYEELLSVIAQIGFVVNSTCPTCPKRMDIARKLKEVKVKK